ncbi:folate/biopterin transporter [Chloropicon primus]|uniref:Folate/biopterin transporter n=1 Tax=Chloropicon primus TaxID=1764295 RepID=A0A5B8MF08_9CHLO|nr:folate/biopterin transporter [Chloropicon primus]UPQ98437.1 folate/biopterin transporter [Chloropicon primus]|eukprot:QDZ19228.1 folate/biopterin transporter [Chloropicon primus]
MSRNLRDRRGRGDAGREDVEVSLGEGPVPSYDKRGGKKGGLLDLEISGVPATDLCAILSVYFVQGSMNLSRIALSLFLKDDLNLSPAQASLIESSSYIPWTVKPIYGFLSDSLPLNGYKRKSYLQICGILNSIAWLFFAYYVNSPALATVAIVGSAVGTACSDVVVDSIVVERSRDQETAGTLQSLCWMSYATGGIISSFFSGKLVENMGSRGVFKLTALVPLLTFLFSFVLHEERIKGSESKKPLASRIGSQTKRLAAAVKQPAILYPVIFIFIFQATPNPEGAFFFFKTEKLGFSPDFLGQVNFVSRVAMLLGIGFYNRSLKRVPLRTVFLWVIIVGFLLGSTQLLLISGYNRTLGISDEIFALGDSAVLTVLGQLSFMPLLVLAAQICPEGVEATLFATLMSILNSGSFIGTSLGASLTQLFGVTSENFDNMFSLVSTCLLLQLVPLMFLKLVPDDLTSEE